MNALVLGRGDALVDEVVAFTRAELGAPAARSLGADADDRTDLLLEAICLLSCAGRFPPDPLGRALAEAVADEPIGGPLP